MFWRKDKMEFGNLTPGAKTGFVLGGLAGFAGGIWGGYELGTCINNALEFSNTIGRATLDAIVMVFTTPTAMGLGAFGGAFLGLGGDALVVGGRKVTGGIGRLNYNRKSDKARLAVYEYINKITADGLRGADPTSFIDEITQFIDKQLEKLVTGYQELDPQKAEAAKPLLYAAAEERLSEDQILNFGRAWLINPALLWNAPVVESLRTRTSVGRPTWDARSRLNGRLRAQERITDILLETGLTEEDIKQAIIDEYRTPEEYAKSRGDLGFQAADYACQLLGFDPSYFEHSPEIARQALGQYDPEQPSLTKHPISEVYANVMYNIAKYIAEAQAEAIFKE